MRAYPLDLVLALTRDLLGRGVSVVLLGRSSEVQATLPQAPPLLLNLIDQTPDITALAAALSQLDALICPDTLFMHLAGVLRVPTLAVLTSSATRVAGGYPTVTTVTAAVPCRPCGASADTCPAGYSALPGATPCRFASATPGRSGSRPPRERVGGKLATRWRKRLPRPRMSATFTFQASAACRGDPL